MFERYTERARQAVFFARFEAGALGAQQIGVEHMLLGVLHADSTLTVLLGVGAVRAIRKSIEQLATPGAQPLLESQDMAVGVELRSVLKRAEEEATSLNHKRIDTPHLVLGLLSGDGNAATELLRSHGLEYERYRTG